MRGPGPGKGLIEGAVSLCACFDIVSWSRRVTAADREALQHDLNLALRLAAVSAVPAAGPLPTEYSGDGALMVFPPGIVEGAVIGTLVGSLVESLHRRNQQAPSGGRMRVRAGLARGIVRTGDLGWSSDAVVQVARLVDSDEVRQAVNRYPEADLALIVAGSLYQDVFRQGLTGLDQDAFWPAYARRKTFESQAFLYVSDRSTTLESEDTPEPPSADGFQVAAPLPVFVPGWTAGTGAAAPDETITEEQVRATLRLWRDGRDAPLTPEIIRVGFSEIDAMVTEAGRLISERRYRSALEHLDLSMSVVPHVTGLAVSAARLLLATGRFNALCRELLDDLLGQDSHDARTLVEPLMLRAEAWFADRNYAGAANDLEQALSVIPAQDGTWALAMLRLGDCREILGGLDAAEAVWREVVKVRPLNPDVGLRLGYLELKRRRELDAKVHLARALTVLRRSPASAMATDTRVLEHALLMGLYTARRDFGAISEARAYLQQAHEVDPGNCFTLVEMAIDQDRQGATGMARWHAGRAMYRAFEDPNGNLALDRLRDHNLLDQRKYGIAMNDWRRTQGQALT
ncbi:tetratricopeptide repeat protein [Kineosporia babensis]|uniref:Tetratricopeptide repeat protein n=1 Tax=Kineosporia babensis TaxID=499548 RepID=A0A9X1NB34_9ACTN|nr:hypothetical protein [Kineosporia babensis]MCD5310574.1 hypothetical protein [Kineosporia babensis]